MAERLKPPYDAPDGLVCSCVLNALPLVQYRFKKAGWIQQDFAGLVFQWGYRDNATAVSATTHNGGGIGDFAYSLVDTDAKMRVWQECGWTPFRRRLPQWTGDRHGHNLVNGCPHLDPQAADQITDYRAGRNGLVSHAAYDGPTGLYRTWQQAQTIYADLIEEMELMDAGTLQAVARAVAAELGSNDDFKTKLAMAVRNLVLGVNDGGLGDVIPTWHQNGEGGNWRLQELLRNIRLEVDGASGLDEKIAAVDKRLAYGIEVILDALPPPVPPTDPTS